MSFQVGGRVSAAYAASKAGVVAFSRSTAIAYVKKGIRVNTVIPGVMHTPLVEHRLVASWAPPMPRALVAKRHASVPMGRMGDAWDVANAVLFLASDEARYITATQLVVDGGMTAARPAHELPASRPCTRIIVTRTEETTMSRPVIISCALTGGGDTTAQQPATCRSRRNRSRTRRWRARAAGAAIVHIHVRDPKTGKPSRDLALYREVVRRIRSRGSDVLINLTTGAGARFTPDDTIRTATRSPGMATPEERMAHVLELRPDICSLDIGDDEFRRARLRQSFPPTSSAWRAPSATPA